MTKQTINVGRTPNDRSGDSLRVAFQKVNANFSELYTALGLNTDGTLNLGAFEFAGSTMSTTDSTPIVIDQKVTVASDLTVGGDIVPSVANGGNLGSLDRPFRSLYVSNSTVFLGGVPLSLEAGSNTLKINNVPISQTIDISDLTDTEGLLGGGSGNPFNQDLNTDDSVTFNSVGATTVNVSQINGTNPGDELVIQANNHNWTFDTNGNLTLPAGGDILDSNGTSVLGGGAGGGGVDGLTGNTDFEPDSEGDTRYELNINGDIKLRTHQQGTGPDNLGVGISLGNTSTPIRSGVIAIGNNDVGYDSKQGGVYIGYEAGWNDPEDPQGEYAIAIGARAARNFAQDNSITLNATGENLDPTADGLYIKPIREVVENTAKALYYNTTTGEVTYNDAGGGSNSYTPDEPPNWNSPTVNTIQAALDELAARMTAFENFEIDGGNAYTPAAGELLIDGNGA